jgi:hypothetical protein
MMSKCFPLFASDLGSSHVHADLDLLYTASTLAAPPAPSFTSIASSHALKSSRSHIRADGSTCHVVNFDPVSGEVKERFANQGYKNESCWSRGQAWGIVSHFTRLGIPAPHG